MKIVIPITGFGKSGGYRVLSELANSWIKLGHEVIFISHVKSIPVYFPTIAKVLWVDNNGEECDFNEKSEEYLLKTGIVQAVLKLNSLRIALNRYCSDFDIILANQSFSSYPVHFSKIKGIKWYYIQAYEPEYLSLANGIRNKIYSKISSISYRLPLNKIVNSPIYCDYKNIFTNRVVYPGIDFNIFYSKSDITKFNLPLRIGVIGRREIFKGTQYVFDAYEKLKSQIEVELWVAFGESDLKEDGIKILHPNSDNELANFYRNVDIIVAPGTIQLGAVHYPVIEAMACGTSVITTGYYPANNQNSWIVPPHNSDAIVKCVLDILANKDIIKEKILKGLIDTKEFKWEDVSKKMLREFGEK